LVISKEKLEIFFKSISGLGKKKIENIFKAFEENDIVQILEQEPFSLTEVKGITNKIVEKIITSWVTFKEEQEG